MTTDATPAPDPLIEHGRAVRTDIETQRLAQAEAERKAIEAAEAAAELQRQADLAARTASRDATSSLVAAMRQISDSIDRLRHDAEQAVLDRSDPVGAWITYRLGAAEELGRWQALCDDYRNHGGTRVPEPGPARKLPPLPGSGVPPGRAEDLTGFITAVLQAHEPATRTAARDEAADLLRHDKPPTSHEH